MRDYVNPNDKKSPVEIKLCTAQNWLHRLSFEYQNIKKDVFVDRHERPDVVADYERFLKTTEELKPYMVKFNEDGIMKDKKYSYNCVVDGGIR